MIFNGYWFDCEPDEQDQERERQEKYRMSRLAQAVKAFFPEVFEFGVIRTLMYGYREVDLDNPPPFFSPI